MPRAQPVRCRMQCEHGREHRVRRGLVPGEPLLMVHGNGGSIADMSAQIAHFRQRHQVIAMDSRDQGKSAGSPDKITYQKMTDDLAALIRCTNSCRAADSSRRSPAGRKQTPATSAPAAWSAPASATRISPSRMACRGLVAADRDSRRVEPDAQLLAERQLE